MENGLIQLKDTTIIKSSKMEELVNKGLELKAKSSGIAEVTDETIELSKEVKKEASSTITTIEQERLATGRIIKQVKEEIDAKADELKKPFIEVKEEIEGKIKVYTEEEEKKKEEERKRIGTIIEKINTFEDEEELKKYYKSLEVNDQRKKAIAEAGVDRKQFIINTAIKKAKDEVIKKIEAENDIVKLENIDLGDFKEELGVIVSNKLNKLKLDALEQEKKDREEKEKLLKENTEKFIESLHGKTIDELKEFKIIELSEYEDIKTIEDWIKMRINTLEKIASDKELKELKEKNAKLEEDKRIDDLANKKLEEEKPKPKVISSVTPISKPRKAEPEQEKQTTVSRENDLDVVNYKNYCITCDLDYKKQESLENYLDWTRNAIEENINLI